MGCPRRSRRPRNGFRRNSREAAASAVGRAARALPAAASVDWGRRQREQPARRPVATDLDAGNPKGKAAPSGRDDAALIKRADQQLPSRSGRRGGIAAEGMECRWPAIRPLQPDYVVRVLFDLRVICTPDLAWAVTCSRRSPAQKRSHRARNITGAAFGPMPLVMPAASRWTGRIRTVWRTQGPPPIRVPSISKARAALSVRRSRTNLDHARHFQMDGRASEATSKRAEPAKSASAHKSTNLWKPAIQVTNGVIWPGGCGISHRLKLWLRG